MQLTQFSINTIKNLENRTIIINDDISSDIVEMALLPLMEMDNDGTGREITILLNTCGGEVYSGFCLIDYIEKLKTKNNYKSFRHGSVNGGFDFNGWQKQP